MSEDDIEKKAVEEILQEAKRARERAKEHGTFGWNKPKIAAVNKRFLKNTLVSTMRGQMTHRDFKNFDRGDGGPAVLDRRGSKRKDESPEKTDGMKKTIQENSKTTDDKEDITEPTQPDKSRREKVYNTFDYIRLNETFKRNYFKEKDSEENDKEDKDSKSSKAKETSDEHEVKEQTTNDERPKIELKFKKQMR